MKPVSAPPDTVPCNTGPCNIDPCNIDPCNTGPCNTGPKQLNKIGKMKKIGAVVLALMFMGLCHLSVAAQEKTSFVVIVHPDNPAKSVSKKKVSRLLLKELAKWDGGLIAQPVDLDSNSDVRRDFSRNVHGRSVSSIKNYWQRQIFSGRAVPPPEVANDNAVISHVKSNPGAIGYVSASARLSGAGVKVLDLSSE